MAYTTRNGKLVKVPKAFIRGGWRHLAPAPSPAPLPTSFPEDKGKYKGSCNRSCCLKPNAVWYNHSTRKILLQEMCKASESGESKRSDGNLRA